MRYPETVEITDVAPRDGLQNDPCEVSTAVRVELIERLADAGLRSIEAGSFVSPKWVPKMADSAEVFARIARRPGVRYTALTPNKRGIVDALAAGADAVNVFSSATEAFSQANTNCTIAEGLERFRPVVEAARAAAVPVHGAITCCLGCPFEGEVAPAQVGAVAGALRDLGCEQIGVADTIGTGTPDVARAAVRAAAEHAPMEDIVLHFHDTYGQALANILACLELGARRIDSSVAGLGGCPYAPGATGNVATEDVVYMLHGMGIETGIDLEKLIDTALFISDAVGRPPVSRVGRAMLARRQRAAA